MRVHLLDGTYELFRHHFGRPPRRSRSGQEVAATVGVLESVLAMLERGTTHLGVATDHVIVSFRNDLWPGYKDGSGVDPALSAQFPLLEEALSAMGVRVWPMVELEADDALAAAAAAASNDGRVEQVLICTPDKDLAQCVQGRRVVQLDRRSGQTTDEDGVVAKFGVSPGSIPDWLALVGDSADGFPGLPGWGKQSASLVLAHYHHLADVPDEVADWDWAVRRKLRSAPALSSTLRQQRSLAELFVRLATLRTDAPVLGDPDELAWHGPGPGFGALCAELGTPRLAERAAQLAASAAARRGADRP
ncbi:MAG TPA: 5'-3' exonuclease H3TH domain-containing protein [Acidimicrobiales bacterium]|nr:5'-3' exonuclease H3TH domain-containing protein [Acidimicrobiales bacterium]